MKIFLSLLLICFSFKASAESYYCANTYQTVKTGDPIEQVRARCGSPTTEGTQKVTSQNPVSLTHLSYTLMPLIGTNNVAVNTLLASLPTMVITIKDNKVFQIKKNGIIADALGPISCPGNGMISVGDNASLVQLACGPPTSVSYENIMDNSTKNVKVWTYNHGPYLPQISFLFENDQLSQIQSGQLGY